jgi:hypothetical protein
MDNPTAIAKARWTAATPYFPTGVYAITREKIKAQKEWRGKIKWQGRSKGQTKQSLGD